MRSCTALAIGIAFMSGSAASAQMCGLTEIGFVAGDNARDMTKSGTIVVDTQGNDGFRIMDVSDPTSPTLLSQTLTPEAAAFVSSLDEDNGVLFVYGTNNASPSQGMVLAYDISDLESPSVLGTFAVSGLCYRVEVDEGVAYISTLEADNQAHVHALDVSDPTSITEMDDFIAMGIVFDLKVRDGYAYMSVSSFGIQILDVSDPTSLTTVGTHLTVGPQWTLALAGVRAYMADGSAMRIIDVSDPTAPAELGSYAFAGAYAVGADGEFASVGNFANEGLDLVDVSAPMSPVHLDSIETPESPESLIVEAPLVYDSDRAGLVVYDIGTCITCAQQVDVNDDDAINILDFVSFQNAFQMHDPDADCNGDQIFDITDFVCFQNAFAGCVN